MPPKRYGKGQIPLVVGLKRPGGDSQDSQNSHDGQEKDASTTGLDALQDPFAYDADTNDGLQKTSWDFSDSTTSKKVMSPAKRMPPKEERVGPRNTARNEPSHSSRGDMVSSSFIGEFGQVGFPACS